jgi:hypothetical protein
MYYSLVLHTCIHNNIISTYVADTSTLFIYIYINPLNAELNPICHLLAFAAAPYIYDISRLRVNFALISLFIQLNIQNSLSHILEES